MLLSRKESAEGRRREEGREDRAPPDEGGEVWKHLDTLPGAPDSAEALLRCCKNCSNKLQQFGFVVKRKFQNPCCSL